MDLITVKTTNPGKVYLIGAGPGDPDLITVRGLMTLRDANVIVYDRLANPACLKKHVVLQNSFMSEKRLENHRFHNSR